MSSSSSAQKQKQQQQEDEDDKVKRCGCCGREDLALKKCLGCGSVAYCDAKCQTADWPSHKTVCNRIKKEKKAQQEKASMEAPKSSGSGLADMGSILAALMPPPRPQRYTEVDLWNACFDDHSAEVQNMLKQQGLDINWVDPEQGATAAYVSADKGYDKCLSLLAQNRADLSKPRKDGTAPIHIACQYARHACLLVLLDNGVDANLPTANEFGDTPVTIACQFGHVKILALLLNRGVDPNLANKNGNTAAHKACRFGHLKILELLVQRHANLNMKNVDGETPLDFARAFKQRECIDLLIVNGSTGMNKEDLPSLSEATKV